MRQPLVSVSISLAGRKPPAWPAEPGKQLMMMHVGVAVDDLAQAVAAAQELGAPLAGCQPQDNCPVLSGAYR
jgi:hypothetical protein